MNIANGKFCARTHDELIWKTIIKENENVLFGVYHRHPNIIPGFRVVVIGREHVALQVYVGKKIHWEIPLIGSTIKKLITALRGACE